MITLRLVCSTFWVDVRLREINGGWVASADTPDGPSLGLGKCAVEAVEHALEPFEGIVDELLASLPRSGLRLAELSGSARTFGGIACAVGWPKPVGMPADLVQGLSLVALVAATLEYVILMRHRQERRDATQLNRVATDTGLRGLVRVLLVEP